MNFLDLPEEIIEDILLKLPFNDQLSTRLVNRQLLPLNNRHSIAKNRKTVVNDYFRLGSLYTISTFKVFNLNIRIDYVKFKRWLFTDRINSFWEKNGEDVTCLELVFKGEYSHEVVLDVCKQCPNLENLTVELFFNAENERQVNELPVVSTYKLKNLTLIQHLLNRDSSPQCELSDILKSLSVSSTVLQSISIGGDFNPGSDPLVEHLKTLIDGPLRELDLYLDLDRQEIDSLLEKSNRLTKLHVSNRAFTDTELSNLCFKSKNLKALRLTCNRSWPFTLNGPLEMSLLQLQLLTHISLYDSIANDDFVGLLSIMPNLSCLELAQSGLLSDDGIVKLFGAKPWPRLTHLYLSALFLITSQGMMSILPNLPNITMLSIRYCQNVSHAFLKSLFEHNVRLKYLTFNRGVKETDMPSPMPGINNLSNLRHLDLEYGLAQLKGLKLPKLEILRARACTSFSLAETFSNNHSLNHVILGKYNNSFFRGVQDSIKVKHSAYNRMLIRETMYSTEPCDFPRFRRQAKGPIALKYEFATLMAFAIILYAFILGVFVYCIVYVYSMAKNVLENM